MIKLLLTLISIILWPLFGACSVEITLEHAKTPSELAWGLMQRHSLPKDHGMLFHFKKSTIASIWMFNCYIDLSVAFLDKDLIIQEIHELKAYPEKMDPSRPVLRLRDISLYRSYDPIMEFYRNNSINSSQPTSYALEMNAGWFAENQINEGDKLHLLEDTTRGYFSKSNDRAQALEKNTLKKN